MRYFLGEMGKAVSLVGASCIMNLIRRSKRFLSGTMSFVEVASSCSLVLFSFIFLLQGCSWFSVDKHIEGRAQELSRQLEKEPQWASLPRREISWSKAVDMMMKQNLDLKDGRQSLRQAEHSVTRVFTQMIPGVNLDWMLSKDISELTRVGSRDVEYNTNILFNLPSMTQVPFDYYAAKSSVYTAKKSYELKEREMISRLYRQVILYESSMRDYRNAMLDLSFDDDGTQRKRVIKEWEDKQRDISVEFSSLLGSVEAQWFVNPATMPRINWGAYKQASKKLDDLVVTMMAMELESSRLQVWNVKMQFFPSLDVNFYSPTLFTGSGGTYQGFFAGAGDMKVNMSLKEKLDTRLDVWFEYKTAQENYKMMQQRIRLRLLERRDKVAALMKSRQLFEEWRKAKMEEIAFMESRSPATGEEYLDRRKNLRKLYKEVESKTAENAEVEAALIMEYGWLK